MISGSTGKTSIRRSCPMRLLKIALRAHNILRKSPSYIVRRVVQEAECELDRWLAPRRAQNLDRDRLLAMALASSADALRNPLRSGAYTAVVARIHVAALDRA